ncbi:MAG TPA: iron ABC transporter permease [Vicinamibacteria bacterium]|nr:iron ABC transporter permease [Vicinamibacteria bacterium]
MIGGRRAVLIALAAALPLALLIAVSAGTVPLPAAGVLGSLLRAVGVDLGGELPPVSETILWAVRLPRVLLAAVVGGGLAVVGATLQSVFRNPLADSGLLGVGAGAALGAVAAVRLGWAGSTFLALPAAAFVGAMAAVLVLYGLSQTLGGGTVYGLLLTGISVSALAAAGTSMLLVATEEFRVKTVLFWLAGGLDGRGWVHLRVAGLVVLAGCLGLFALSRILDVLSLGDEEAAALGLRVHGSRLVLLGLAALVAGASTAAAGAVPFVGLVAPHALRPVAGSLGRHLLPAAFLGGALLVVFADLAARVVSDRMDLPLGSLTAFVGAPYFLFALRKAEGRR